MIMKEKFKGIIIGLAVGSMLTGATAYAANGKGIPSLHDSETPLLLCELFHLSRR